MLRGEQGSQEGLPGLGAWLEERGAGGPGKDSGLEPAWAAALPLLPVLRNGGRHRVCPTDPRTASSVRALCSPHSTTQLPGPPSRQEMKVCASPGWERGQAGEEERRGQCRDHPEGPSRQRELPELWPASIRALWGRESRWPLSLRDGGWCAWGRNCLGLGFKIPKSDGRQWREGSETGTGSEWELWGDPWGRGEGCWSPPAAAGLPGSEFLDGPSDGRASLTPRSVCPSAHPATHWDRPLPASARGLGPGAL